MIKSSFHVPLHKLVFQCSAWRILWSLVIYGFLGLPLSACATQPGQIKSTVSPSRTSHPTSTLTFSLNPTKTYTPIATAAALPLPSLTPITHPMAIEVMRRQSYPGSPIQIEQKLSPGSNYLRYIASYRSEGLKIFALLTVPTRRKPANGYPVIVFNHGYIPPKEYKTTQRYVAYVDALAREGYIVFRPDYRGHGESEGSPSSVYMTPAYTMDVLNAVEALKNYADADPTRIGMWGHSMGGQITLRCMVINKDVKVGVIWGGVVASYEDLYLRWRHNPPPLTPTPIVSHHWGDSLARASGDSRQNPTLWDAISPNSYLKDLSGPIQLHHGEDDEVVPAEFSKLLFSQASAAGKTVELFLYKGDNHNISINFSKAMERTIEFFNRYLKQEK